MQTKDHAKFNIVLVSGVIEKNGEFLIAQRGHDEIQAPGKWSIPGGKVEVEGEDLNVLEDSLKREIKEEVGIVIHDDPIYVRSGSFIRVDKSPVVTTLFLCKWKSGIAKPLEDSIDVAWIDIKDLDKFDFASGIKKTLKEAYKKYKMLNGKR
jgi:8-oxo-dGTP pyrophosphatase MutT (NUDIX family)